MNKKGFTLIELLAVIVILGVVLLLAVPSILDSINASKNSSYKILVDNIKTSAETYYQECEYGNLSDISKYGQYACTINNNTITTTIGALAQTGILKVSTSSSGNLIVEDPRDTTKSLNECEIKIIKTVDNNFKVTYKINGSNQNNCPTTEELQ